LARKLRVAGAPGCREERLGPHCFDDLAFIQEDNAIGAAMREIHFMVTISMARQGWGHGH
jgi:hypothetical protein